MIAVNGLLGLFTAQAQMDKHITITKLESFRRLQIGWHYGEGQAFNENPINDAIQLHNSAIKLGFFETDAFPGVDGSIMLTIYHKSDYLEFTMISDNQLMYRRETDDIEVSDETVITIEEAKTILEQLRQATWTSSDSYTSDILTAGSEDLLHQHLRTSGMGFRLLTSNAFAAQKEEFVNTL